MMAAIPSGPSAHSPSLSHRHSCRRGGRGQDSGWLHHVIRKLRRARESSTYGCRAGTRRWDCWGRSSDVFPCQKRAAVAESAMGEAVRVDSRAGISFLLLWQGILMRLQVPYRHAHYLIRPCPSVEANCINLASWSTGQLGQQPQLSQQNSLFPHTTRKRFSRPSQHGTSAGTRRTA